MKMPSRSTVPTMENDQSTLPFAPKFPKNRSRHQEKLAHFEKNAKKLSSNSELMRCVICGNPASDIHHRDGRLRNPSDVDNPRILYPFCRECHDKIQFGEWKQGVFHRWTITSDEMLYDNERFVRDLTRSHNRFIQEWEELNDRS